MSQEKRDPSSLNGAIVRFASVAAVVAFLVWGPILGTQQEYLRNASQRAVAEWNQETQPLKWSNDFWEEIANPNSRLTKSTKLQRYVRDLAASEDGAEAGGLVVITDVTWLNRCGILDADGELSAVSLERVAAIRAGKIPTPNPIPPEVDLDDPQFHRDAYAEFFLYPPFYWAWVWTALAAILYPSARQARFDEHYVWVMGPWLGIDRTEGAYVRRALIAVMYTPVLLPMAVVTGAWRALAAAWHFPVRARLRAWWKTFRNPYRAQIREAERALDELRTLEADPGTIRGAEELLELWRTRHDDETSKATDAAARTRREARIARARDTLLRLDADAVADGIKSEPRFPDRRQTTGGS